ncbi:MAG: hypothetical protein KBG15_01795 [Kofleriaceae bacterium]|nr:hypothetical protein [Kofleriaceae bacterium]
MVESVDQTGDSVNGFAGVLALSLALPNYGALAINRRPTDGQYFMTPQTQAGVGVVTLLGVLTSLFRVKLGVTWVNNIMTLATTIITTATAKTQTTTSVAAPTQMVSLTLGVNRYQPTGSSKIVCSE